MENVSNRFLRFSERLFDIAKYWVVQLKCCIEFENSTIIVNWKSHYTIVNSTKIQTDRAGSNEVLGIPLKSDFSDSIQEALMVSTG